MPYKQRKVVQNTTFQFNFSGPDGTRTRDPLRDRQVF